MPVATAAHTGSGCVGLTVARSMTAAFSSSRANAGSRPSATRGRMYSSDAPSSSSITRRGPASRRTSAAGRRATGDGSATAGPRAASGSSNEAKAASTKSVAPTRLPRRPNE